MKISKSYRGVSRTPNATKNEFFVALVQECYLLANVAKESILDVVQVLDLPLR